MDDNNAGLRLEIDKWFDAHFNEMLDDLSRLIEIKSVRRSAEKGAPYGADSRTALTLARSMMESRGFSVGEFEDMIITADFGPDPPLLGILAHLDVVGAGEGWGSDPYKMTVRDGRIYGRGAIDDKGPAVAAMYAMYCTRDIRPGIRHGLRIILGTGEEVGCEDIALYLSKNKAPPHVFTPDAVYPVVNVEKGRIAPYFGASWDNDPALPRVISITGGRTINVVPDRAQAVVEGLSVSEAEAFCHEYSAKTGTVMSLTPGAGVLTVFVEGAATHASTPNEGSNAQTALLEMLSAMPFADSKGFGYIRALNRLFPHGDYHGSALGITMSDEVSGELTLNFGVLDFSGTGFTGNFDSRTPACADGIDLSDMTRTALEREGISLTSITRSKSHYTPEDSPFVQTLLRVYGEYTGNPGVCSKLGGQTYVHEIPGGVAFGCAMPGASNNAHGANEFISTDDFILSAKMFAAVIIEMCG